MTKLHINHSLNETLQNHNTCTGSIKTGLFTCTLHVNVKYISTSIHDFFNRKKIYENLSIIFFFNKKNPIKQFSNLQNLKFMFMLYNLIKPAKKF